jgi:hypothetical protein
LFDRGAIETLESCDNNNERHEILSTIAEHVIPNYDDIRGVYPEIRRALETAVQAARNTETKPIESPFGNLTGKTSKDVTLAAVGILNTLRYVDIEATFRSLIDIYKGEQDGEVRKQIVDAIKHLVLPLDMVDNSISLCKHLSGWFFRHWAARTGHLILE